MNNENNVIELLKQALLFYSSVNNYKVDRTISDSIFSPIEMDSGTQARFALKLIEDNAKVMEGANEEYLKSLLEHDSDNVDVLNTIIALKELENGNK